MNFNYYIPTKILFGKGALENLHQEKLPGKKALIVISSGNSMRKYGYLDRLLVQLEKAGVSHAVFDKILPNPVKRHVDEGAAMARAEGCDFIIGLGGGSSIDAAKAIAIMATNEGDYWRFVKKECLPPVCPLPIVAVTTTAGTGTEADPWTVTTNEETVEKLGFGYDETFPTLSVVDPSLMMTVPPMLTAYQGFDALFHSTEGYINNTNNPISDMYALTAIKMLGRSLVTAVNHGDDEDARAEVALANTIAGMVESTSGCISEHAMEHAMSAHHPELAHGAGLIMLSAAYYAHFAYIGACDDRLIDMARALGKTDARDPMDFVIALRGLQEACHVNEIKMSDYGIQADELPVYTKEALEKMPGMFEVDPVMLSPEDVLSIYKKSYR